MAVAEYYLEDVRKCTGLTDQQIIDGLTNLGAPCEANGVVLVVELTPNRPDWFSLEGICRSLLSYYSKETHRKYAVKKSACQVIVEKEVASIRPYSLCAIVKNLSFNPRSIEYLVQMQEKIMGTLGRKTRKFGMGFFNLEKITFPVTYRTMDPRKIRYKPLNYPHEADAIEILAKHPKGIENGQLLKGCKDYPVYVDAKGKVLVLVPIVNSEEMGKVDGKTTDVFIEVTGMDMNALGQALKIVVCALVDMGGDAYSVEMKYPDKTFASLDFKEDSMPLDVEFTNKLLGTSLTKPQISELLARMGYRISGNTVNIPPYRIDVLDFVDIVEDVAIAYGYNSIAAPLPAFYSEGKQIETYQHVDQTLRGMGFLEVVTFVLTNDAALKKIGKTSIKVLNPATEDYTTLRNTIIPSFLEVIATNKTRGLPQKYYEIGMIYENNATKKQIVFGMVDQKMEFSTFQGYVQRLLEECEYDYQFERDNNIYLSQGANIISKQIRGSFGIVKKEVALQFGIDFDIALAVLELK